MRGNAQNNSIIQNNNINNTKSSNNRDVKPEIYASQKKRLLAKAASEWNSGMKQEPGIIEAPIIITEAEIAKANQSNINKNYHHQRLVV